MILSNCTEGHFIFRKPSQGQSIEKYNVTKLDVAVVWYAIYIALVNFMDLWFDRGEGVN